MPLSTAKERAQELYDLMFPEKAGGSNHVHPKYSFLRYRVTNRGLIVERFKDRPPVVFLDSLKTVDGGE